MNYSNLDEIIAANGKAYVVTKTRKLGFELFVLLIYTDENKEARTLFEKAIAFKALNHEITKRG